MYIDKNFYKTLPKRFKNKWSILSMDDIISDPSTYIGARIYEPFNYLGKDDKPMERFVDLYATICSVKQDGREVQMWSGRCYHDIERLPYKRLFFTDSDKAAILVDLCNEQYEKEDFECARRYEDPISLVVASAIVTKKVFTSIMNKGRNDD